MTRRRGCIPLAALAIGLIVTGCGSDSSGETTAPAVSIPAVTAPGVASTAPATVTAPTASGTTKTNTTYNPKAPDSATNDVPPAKGSPQAQFEQQCQQRGSCD